MYSALRTSSSNIIRFTPRREFLSRAAREKLEAGHPAAGV